MSPQGMLSAELSLPNDASFLRLARSFVREIATLSEFPDDEVEELVLAADEACTNTIEHAFEPGEAGSFTLRGQVTHAALTLSICDQGLPFDSSLAPIYTPPQGGAVLPETRGLGLFLIHHAVDEMYWINRGKEGKELQLVKRRHQPDVTDRFTQAELASYQEDVPRAPEQEYTVRRLQPEDAIQVAQCIYRTYGYTYSNEDLYYPERIVQQNESGELISEVVLDESGEVVGHAALERSGLGPVAELGQAVVVPAHRGRKLLQRMTVALHQEGHRLGLSGLYGQPTTAHTASQKVIDAFDYRLCGITLGYIPRTRIYKNMQTDSAQERTSLGLSFQYLKPPAPAMRYVPECHWPMLKRIYAGLGAPVEFQDDSFMAGGPGQVVVRFNQGYGIGKIGVRQVGADTAAEVRRALHDLCDMAHAEAIYLELPLAQPATADLCRLVEDEGFFFSGVGPQFAPDGDSLRMQYLNTPLDPAMVQLLTPFGHDLLDYIVQEMERVKRKGSK
jgi:anti-sigma regulatory factor (Ser/Thr protein kinase)/RimJ/RimL family protein N-acetyltransferase